MKLFTTLTYLRVSLCFTLGSFVLGSFMGVESAVFAEESPSNAESLASDYRYPEFRKIIDRVISESAKKPEGWTDVFLKDSVITTLNTHPDGQIAELQVEKAYATRTIARSGFFPQIDAYTSWSQNHYTYPFNNTVGFGDAGLIAKIRIFDFGKVRDLSDAATQRVIRSEDLFHSVQNSLTLRAASVFLLVLKERINRTYAEKNKKDHEHILNLLLNYGDRAQPTDIDLAKTRLGIASAALNEALKLEGNAEIEYNNVTGETLKSSTEEEDQEEFKKWLVRPEWMDYAPTRLEAMTIIFNKNPNLQATYHQIEATKKELAAAKANRLPALSSFAQGFRRSPVGRAEHVQNPPSDDRWGYAAGFEIKIPVFTGFKLSAEQEIARANVKESELNQVNLFRNIQAELSYLYLAFSQREEQIISLDQAVENGKKGVAALNDFCAKTPPTGSTIQNLLDQMRGLFTSSLALNNEAWGFLADVYRLHALQGTLIEDLKLDQRQLPP